MDTDQQSAFEAEPPSPVHPRRVDLGALEAKLRRPLIVFVLTLATLGLYYFVWYYLTNRELREYGEDVKPGYAVLAMTAGVVLIVPPFVSQWRYYNRIRRAQQRAGVPLDDCISNVSGVLLYVVALVLLPVKVIYTQIHFNRLWHHVREEQAQIDRRLRVVTAA